MTIIAPPPPSIDRHGTKLKIGHLVSTVLPDMDFETFSAAGFVWNESTRKFSAPLGATKKGLRAVGTPAYSEHESTEVLSLSYNLKQGRGVQRWKPGELLPVDLFQYLLKFDPFVEPSYDQAGIIEAHNAMFELRICLAVCVDCYGWPVLELEQFRCSASKARAHALPGKLEELGRALNIKHQKDPEGERLLEKFSWPRNPTKKDPRTRILPSEEPADAIALYRYNDRDTVAESEASALIPDLPPFELKYWLADQKINYRGVGCDVESVHSCIAILNQALEKYNDELRTLTHGMVCKASELAKMKTWLQSEFGIVVKKMDNDVIDELLKRKNLPDLARRAMEIRQLIGSASVKKVYAMARQVTRSRRLCDMAIYHGARTGRDNGDGVQPLNMPKAGPTLRWCATTDKPFSVHKTSCPWCGLNACMAFGQTGAWGSSTESDPGRHVRAVETILEVMATKSLDLVEYYFGNALLCISGCARGLFMAREGYQLLGVDYSSIEAVASAVLAGEQWRIEAFQKKRDIYLESASRITGKSYDWYVANGGKKHPDRQYIGKPAELGLGFGGWLGGWRQFDDSDNFTDEQVKDNIKAWRAASPAIVEMWGGQTRGMPWRPSSFELYGLEGMAILAIQNLGVQYKYRDITYFMECDRLYCKLPSGRKLTYHQPRLRKVEKFEGVETLEISFMGWNSNLKKGPLGWHRMHTYGAQLFENVVQASARDIMAYGVINLEAAGYPVVLRVHDEVVTEVPINGPQTMAEQVKIMTTLPDWAQDWPIRAEGWDAPKKRYQKD